MKINISQYANTLLELTENKTEKEISEVVLRFAQTLKKDGQLKNAGRIMEKFSQLYNEKNGIIVAEITTGQKSENLDVKEIEEFVQRKYGAKKVELKILTDENIKGGIVIRVGDEVLDASVGGKLEKLRKLLAS